MSLNVRETEKGREEERKYVREKKIERGKEWERKGVGYEKEK